jgi:hypothetical protein
VLSAVVNLLEVELRTVEEVAVINSELDSVDEPCTGKADSATVPNAEVICTPLVTLWNVAGPVEGAEDRVMVLELCGALIAEEFGCTSEEAAGPLTDIVTVEAGIVTLLEDIPGVS